LQPEEEDNKIWKVVAWELRDPSTLDTRLKTEFGAGFGDLEDVRRHGPGLDEPSQVAVHADRRLRASTPDGISADCR
jgi:hypothetical protein